MARTKSHWEDDLGRWLKPFLDRELLIQADRLVGGSDAVLVIDDTAVPKKGTHSVGASVVVNLRHDLRVLGWAGVEKALAVRENECHVPDAMYDAIRDGLHGKLDHKSTDTVANQNDPVEISFFNELGVHSRIVGDNSRSRATASRGRDRRARWLHGSRHASPKTFDPSTSLLATRDG